MGSTETDMSVAPEIDELSLELPADLPQRKQQWEALADKNFSMITECNEYASGPHRLNRSARGALIEREQLLLKLYATSFAESKLTNEERRALQRVREDVYSDLKRLRNLVFALGQVSVLERHNLFVLIERIAIHSLEIGPLLGRDVVTKRVGELRASSARKVRAAKAEHWQGIIRQLLGTKSEGSSSEAVEKVWNKFTKKLHHGRLKAPSKETVKKYVSSSRKSASLSQ